MLCLQHVHLPSVPARKAKTLRFGLNPVPSDPMGGTGLRLLPQSLALPGPAPSRPGLPALPAPTPTQVSCSSAMLGRTPCTVALSYRPPAHGTHTFRKIIPKRGCCYSQRQRPRLVRSGARTGSLVCPTPTPRWGFTEWAASPPWSWASPPALLGFGLHPFC